VAFELLSWDFSLILWGYMHFKAGLKKGPFNASNQKPITVVAFLFSREVQ
jgi:hypothetical protein